MLKKIVIAVLTTGFAVASFAQAGAGAPTSVSAKSAAPTAVEQKAETPKLAKHVKHHRHTHKKGNTKVDSTAPAK